MKTIITLAAALFALCLTFVPCQAAGPPADPYAEPADAAPYEPDPAAIDKLKRIDRPITIVVFHGTWCKDCRREMPRFRKILDLAGNANFRLVEYEVNPQKHDALGKFEEYGIQRVPTFIFLEGEKELGRIVEKPQQSLEADFLAIVGTTP